MSHGTNTLAVPEMARNDPRSLDRFSKDFGGLTGEILMAGAVKSVFSDSMFTIHLHGEAIEKAFLRHGLVESRIENRELPCPGKGLDENLDTAHACRVVERGQV
jgi:hypothetical protein